MCWVWHLVKAGEFQMQRVSTDLQVADGLTKAVGSDKLGLIVGRYFGQ